MSNDPDSPERDPSGEDGGDRRRRRSEAVLARLGAPVDSSMPPLPGHSALVRPAKLIAGRAICLCLCASKAEGLDPAIARDLAADFEAVSCLTDSERRYLLDDEPITAEDARFFQWRFEACWLLLWVLGLIPQLTDPVTTCDPERIADIIKGHPSPSALSSAGRLREIDAVLDAADFNHRAFQICVRSGPPYQKIPGGFLAAVLYQREHAFRWLLTGPDTSWDEITIDLAPDAPAD